MDDTSEYKKISEEIHAELNKYTQGEKFNNQIMMNSFLLDKLAEFELRLRRLEKGNARAQSFIGRNTPLK
jgi:hypothetical protein